VRIPVPDPDPTTGLPCRSIGPTVRATEAPPVTGTRTVASMEGTGTAPRDLSRLSSHTKTGEEPALVPVEVREAFTVPVPDTGPGMAAAVGMTVTAPEMVPDTAAAAGLTEEAAIGLPVTHAVTSEVAGGGGGPGLGGRYRPGRLLS
jgi:hypothetical protein